jgi:hypothetical protein
VRPSGELLASRYVEGVGEVVVDGLGGGAGLEGVRARLTSVTSPVLTVLDTMVPPTWTASF